MMKLRSLKNILGLSHNIIHLLVEFECDWFSEELVRMRKVFTWNFQESCAIDPVRNLPTGIIISNRVPFLYSPVSLIVKPVISRIFCARRSPSALSFPLLFMKRRILSSLEIPIPLSATVRISPVAVC
jgi:hypothetical protein